MKGEGSCREAPDDNEEGTSHCIHLRVRNNDFVCCWCGDLFEGYEASCGPHGRYQPKRERRKP